MSTGLPFAIVPLRDVRAAALLNIRPEAVAAALAGSSSRFAYCIAPIEGARSGLAAWHARMRFYNGEDPATGSAAGCAISYLLRHGAVGTGCQVVFEQGVEMLRPSRIIASAHLDGSRVCDVDVGGRTIPVATGHFIRG